MKTRKAWAVVDEEDGGITISPGMCRSIYNTRESAERIANLKDGLKVVEIKISFRRFYGNASKVDK